MRAIGRTLAAVVALSSPVASAEDAAPPAAATSVDEATAKVVALEESVKRHKEEKATQALMSDVGQVLKAHKECTDAKLRSRLLAALGTILKATKEDDLERAAIVAFGDTGDTEAWKYVKSYVQQPNPKETPPLLLDAIAAAGKTKAEGAVDPLLTLVQKSKTNKVAIAALNALGSYGDSKRYRVKVLEGVLDTVRKSVPGRSSGLAAGGGGSGGIGEADESMGTASDAGAETQNRWNALSPVMVETLNRLTGQRATTAKEWFDLYDSHKRDPNALFTNPAK
jgi:hypothetical protein